MLNHVCVLALLFATPALAQKKQDRLRISKLADVDEDFAFQGEYSGLTLPENSNMLRTVGVQVIARGNGKFDGVAHMGGLPGAGGTQERVKLSGTRDADVLELKGDDLSVRIEDKQAKIYSGRGNLLGSFFQVLRKSPTLGLRPPANALVLFDGTNTDEFKNGKMTEDGLLKEGTEFKRTFKDFTLHLEFRTAYMPDSASQKRSNSGVYLQSRYEVQILDSFGLEGAKNECGALYRYKEPDINMCLPPLSWQTYDITFISPRFDTDGKKVQNGRLTVRHNGVLVHNNFEFERKTGAGKPEGPNLFPTKLQNHSDPVRFRNIWIIDHNLATPASGPCLCPTPIAAISN